jgi:hypothetical protein
MTAIFTVVLLIAVWQEREEIKRLYRELSGKP